MFLRAEEGFPQNMLKKFISLKYLRQHATAMRLVVLMIQSSFSKPKSCLAVYYSSTVKTSMRGTIMIGKKGTWPEEASAMVRDTTGEMRDTTGERCG